MGYDSTNFFYKREWFDKSNQLSESDWDRILEINIVHEAQELVEDIKSHLFDEKIEELP